MRRSGGIPPDSRKNPKKKSEERGADLPPPLFTGEVNCLDEHRKTHTSSAVKRRYNQKAYKSITVQFKPELADRIQKYKEQEGISMSELLLRAMDALAK